MGAKTGYADVILRCMGLRPGQGSADGTRYVWCEPDAGVRLLLHSYRDRAVSLAAAEIIRGWAGEDPRALWERLRAEGPARCPPVDPAEVARFLYGTAASYGGPKGSLWDTFLHPEEGGRYGAARADVADKTAALPTVEAAIATDARQVDPAEVARWSLVSGWAAHGKDAGSYGGPGRCGDKTCALTIEGAARRYSDAPTLPATITTDARQVDPREVARYARILTANRLVNPDPETWQNTGRGGYRHGGADFCTPAADLAARFADAVEVPGAAVVDDARAVDPREVARWTLVGAWSFRAGQPASGFRDPWGGLSGSAKSGSNASDGLTRDGMASRYTDAPTLPATITDDARTVEPREVARWAAVQANTQKSGGFDCMAVGGPGSRRPMAMADLASRPAWGLYLPATITDDARKVDPPQLPPGVVVYIDPPYVNTTGYAHAFPRSEWLPVVRRWVEAGALVVVSEAEPIPELMAEGWHAVEITGERKGQKRTFSKQQREWLTMSRPPAWKPSEQMGLFHGRS